jgi:hypothetical protein
MRPAALLALALLVAAAAFAPSARAADPALAAGSRAATIAAPRRALPPREAAAAAAAAALSRAGPLRSSARPAPHYANYTLASSRDTFEICKAQSGLRREISMEELLPLYGLPRELLQRRRVTLDALVDVLAAAAPAARLVIAPLLAGEAELSPVLHPDGRLPRLVHFTVREKNALLPHQALSIATWARLNPGYSILLYDDADIADFMATYHAHLLPLFDRLASQVERTDLWRYLVLCTFGGVYADSDVVAGRPVSTWAQDAGLLTGVENAFTTLAAARRRDYTRVMQIVQWTIAARAGHPVVCRMGDYIARRLDMEAAGAANEEDRDHAILERTGPGIWSSSVHDYLKEHGVEPESMVGGGVVGDVRILPQSTFGCASSTVNLADPIAYVYHMFKGSWRLHEPGKLWQFITHLYAHLFASPHPNAGPPVALTMVGVIGNSSSSGGGGGGTGSSAGAKSSSSSSSSSAPVKAVVKQQGAGAAAAGTGGAAAAKQPVVAKGAAAPSLPALQGQQQQQQQPGPKQAAPSSSSSPAAAAAAAAAPASTASGSQAVERRLHEQLLPAPAVMQLPPLQAQQPATSARSAARDLHLLPLASGLLVVSLICSAAAQRGGAAAGKCGSGGGRPCGGGLTGIWGGAKRLSGRVRSLSALGASGGSSVSAALLPLSQSPSKGSALVGSGSSSGAALAEVAASSTASRSQGSSSSGCLKRSGGSMQCLTGMQ